MTASGDGGSRDETADAGGAAADRDEMHATMLEFAESAPAMAAASIRMQMMMLEQTRAMLGDFTEMMTEASAAMERTDRADGQEN